MKKEQIVSILKDLHEISGFRISLHSPDYLELAAYPEGECDFCREVHSLPGEIKMPPQTVTSNVVTVRRGDIESL